MCIEIIKISIPIKKKKILKNVSFILLIDEKKPA